MFCTKCGKEIADGVKFCTSCGAPVELNASQNAEVENTVEQTKAKSLKITGARAGEESFFYFAFSLFLILFMVGTWISLILFVAFVFYAYLKLPRTVSYNEDKKQFVTNEKSRLKSFKRRLDVSDIKGIRIRKVKLGVSLHHGISVPGQYFVFTFDTAETKKNLFIWIKKENELRELQKMVTDTLSSEGKQVAIDENLSLIKSKEFYAQEPGEKEDFSFGDFAKKNLSKAVAAIVIIFVLGCINIASYNRVDEALDKMENLITKMEKIEKNGVGDMTKGEGMAEITKWMKEINEIETEFKAIDDDELTPEQWDRFFELVQRMSNLN